MQEPGFQIDVEQSPRRRSRQRRHLLIVAAVTGCLAIAMFFAAGPIGRQPDIEEPPAASGPERADPAADVSPPDTDAVEQPTDPPTNGQELIDDDGQTMWVSPTAGRPLDLAYLPPGCQLFVALRPADLLAHPEGKKVLAALGPTGHWARGAIEHATGLRLEAIDRLHIGLRVGADGRWIAAYTAVPVEEASVQEALARLGATRQADYRGQSVHVADELAYWTPEGDDDSRVVIAPTDDMGDVVDLGGSPPPLRRDMERLVTASDSNRHVTILLAPGYVATDGRSLLQGGAGRLEKPLEWFLGERLTAVSWSLHWGDDFFAELRAAATIDTSAPELARRFSQRTDEVPARLEQHIFDLDIQPYGRRLLARLPGMVRAAVRYSRTGYEDDQALIRTYLPVTAGHNLLMAGELALLEPLRATDQRAVRSAAEPQTIQERLDQVTSLSFPRDTLQTALETLAEEIGAEIRLNGQDLQAEGITKNQSFGLDMQNRPAGEILAEILRLANPDKSATGLSDPRHKLVYVIADSAGGPAILVTTRAAAAQRGETLPEVFRQP